MLKYRLILQCKQKIILKNYSLCQYFLLQALSVGAIENSKSNPLEKLLYGLGIRHVGEKAAKVLSQQFGSMDQLMHASKEDFMAIKDIGEATADALLVFFKDEHNQKMIERLKLWFGSRFLFNKRR